MTVTNTPREPEPWARPDNRPDPTPESIAPTLEAELAVFRKHVRPEQRALLERGFRTGWHRHVRAMQPVFARHRQEQERQAKAYHLHQARVGGYVAQVAQLEEEVAFLRARIRRQEGGVRDLAARPCRRPRAYTGRVRRALAARDALRQLSRDAGRGGIATSMPDVLGYRARIGVLVPSTNTILEPELYAMAPHGVTCHVSRMYVPQAAVGSAADAEAFIQHVRAATDVAVRDVLTLEPDWLVHGFTALSFMGGLAGSTRLRDQLEQRAGLPVTTGAEAVSAALRACGARAVAIVTPQPEMVDEHYRQFLAEAGLRVTRLHHIPCRTALDIARVDEATLRHAIIEANGDDVDAIVCVAADLASARLADEAERWLQKPVVAMSTALLWSTLRALHIADQRRGFGFLLRDH